MSRAEKNIEWIENWLTIPDGKFIGKPFKLYDWQKDFMYAVYDNPYITRLAILSMGRKNGKTALAAALLILHFMSDHEHRFNGQIYSGARTKKQAGLVYDYARKIIRMSPVLDSAVSLVRSEYEMRCEVRGTYFRSLPAEAIGAYGLNPYVVIHDELGQVRGGTDDFYESLETAQGAQEEPLSFIISTQASTDDDLLSILIDDALSGKDPQTICKLYTAQGLKNPVSMAGVLAANPGLDQFMNRKEIERNLKKAKRLPGFELEFMNLNLNMRISNAASFISYQEWTNCKGILPDMGECEALYAGLDLARVRDLAAFVIIGVYQGNYYVYPNFWMPKKGLKERGRSQNVPFVKWNKDGLIEATPGKTISKRAIAEYIYEIHEKYGITKIAYDNWHYDQFKAYLLDAGFADWEIEKQEAEDDDDLLFQIFIQGYKSFSPAINFTEQLVLDETLVHEDNPVMNWNIANCEVRVDPAANRKLDKSSDKKKIDGVVAMVMALSLAEQYHEDDTDYDTLASLFE